MRLRFSGLLLGAALLALTGCTSFLRGPRFEAPAGFAADPRAARLVNMNTRRAAWEELVPAPPKLHFKAQLTASGKWWSGSEHFETLYFSFRPGQGEPTLRLRGVQAQVGQTLFEIVVREGQMMVLLPTENAGFQGPIPTEGSPIGDRFGVEPWELNDVFLIGRALATTRFKQEADGDLLRLRPTDQITTGTPSLIELDRATGLPRRAAWDVNGQRYEVRYLAWDWFGNKPPAEPNAPAPEAAPDGPKQLMPKRLEIRREHPPTLLKLEIDHYQFGPLVPPKVFEPYLDSPVNIRPLTELRRVLED